MTPDEAVERFSDAYDETLSADERAAFDAALAADAGLREEYEAFSGLLQATRRVGLDDADEDGPDLLAGVQAKIHRRSRGRYYRDRFSREGHKGIAAFSWVLVAAMAIIVIFAWLMLTYVQLEVPLDETSGQVSE